jgi:hypothetical protein
MKPKADYRDDFQSRMRYILIQNGTGNIKLGEAMRQMKALVYPSRSQLLNSLVEEVEGMKMPQKTIEDTLDDYELYGYNNALQDVIKVIKGKL